MSEKTIRITCKGADTLPYFQIIPFQGNLKDLDKADYKKLRKSILKHGFTEPCSVWEKDGAYYALNGHQRLRVVTEMVKKEGYTCPDLPVSLIQAGTIDEAKEKVLAMTSQYGRMTSDGLHEFMIGANLKLEEVEDTYRFPEIQFEAFKREHYDDSKDGLCDPDEVPEVPEPKAKRGDLYRLGSHRVFCGSATELNAYDKLMCGTKANLVFVDPPYNVDYVGKTKDALKIENDQMDQASFYQFLLDSYSNLFMNTIPGGGIYVAHADTEGANFRRALVESGWMFKQCLVWVKQMLVMGREDYHWKHEPILYGWSPGAAHHWYADRKQTTVLEFDKPARNGEHPTMKPVALVEYLIRNSSQSGQIVLDSFLGSGTTIIACERSGRVCYGIELDPKYVDVIIARWEKFTGNKAELIDTVNDT